MIWDTISTKRLGPLYLPPGHTPWSVLQAPSLPSLPHPKDWLAARNKTTETCQLPVSQKAFRARRSGLLNLCYRGFLVHESYKHRWLPLFLNSLMLSHYFSYQPSYPIHWQTSLGSVEKTAMQRWRHTVGREETTGPGKCLQGPWQGRNGAPHRIVWTSPAGFRNNQKY